MIFVFYQDYFFVFGTYLRCSKWSVFLPNIFLHQIFVLWLELFFELRTFSVFNQINFLFFQNIFGRQHKCTTKKQRFTSHQTSKTIQYNTNPKCRASNTRLLREDENTALEAPSTVQTKNSTQHRLVGSSKASSPLTTTPLNCSFCASFFPTVYQKARHLHSCLEASWSSSWHWTCPSAQTPCGPTCGWEAYDP